jgi:hypothetical protein
VATVVLPPTTSWWSAPEPGGAGSPAEGARPSVPAAAWDMGVERYGGEGGRG